MPVAQSHPLYTPRAGDAIEAAWGEAVSEGVIQRFTNAADRDAKWPDAPDGALAFHDNIVWIKRQTQGNWTSPWYPMTIQQSVQEVQVNDARNTRTIDLTPKFPVALYPATAMVTAEGYMGYSINSGRFWARLATTGENGPQPNTGQWLDYHCEFSWNWGWVTGQGVYDGIGHAVIHRSVDAGARPPIALTFGFGDSINVWVAFHVVCQYIPGVMGSVTASKVLGG